MALQVLSVYLPSVMEVVEPGVDASGGSSVCLFFSSSETKEQTWVLLLKGALNRLRLMNEKKIKAAKSRLCFPSGVLLGVGSCPGHPAALHRVCTVPWLMGSPGPMCDGASGPLHPTEVL